MNWNATGPSSAPRKQCGMQRGLWERSWQPCSLCCCPVPLLLISASKPRTTRGLPLRPDLFPRPGIRNSVSRSLTKQLGMASTQMQPQPGRSAPAALNDLYLVEYGDRVSRVPAEARKDDNFSITATVDRSGAAKVETVLEHPYDETLLTSVRGLISSARFRPASKNGQTVPSTVVFTFNTTTVTSD